jgi:hypothetical protein
MAPNATPIVALLQSFLSEKPAKMLPVDGWSVLSELKKSQHYGWLWMALWGGDGWHRVCSTNASENARALKLQVTPKKQKGGRQYARWKRNRTHGNGPHDRARSGILCRISNGGLCKCRPGSRGRCGIRERPGIRRRWPGMAEHVSCHPPAGGDEGRRKCCSLRISDIR